MARKKPAPAPPRGRRLDAGAWVAAALEALALGGGEAVRVEPLAKALAVTKGSFYWHFPDRRALLDAVFKHWAEGRIAAIRQQAAGSAPPAEVLMRLADLYTRHANIKGLAIELAIRFFARTDPKAAKGVRAVDTERLIHVAKLFAGLGWGADDAQARAVLFYSYLFGQTLLDTSVVDAQVRESAIKRLIAPPR
jgi:AcrR family transcriptional regulator